MIGQTAEVKIWSRALVLTYVDVVFFFFQAEDGIRDVAVTGVQTCALPISFRYRHSERRGKRVQNVRHECDDFLSPEKLSPGFSVHPPEVDQTRHLLNQLPLEPKNSLRLPCIGVQGSIPVL